MSKQIPSIAEIVQRTSELVDAESAAKILQVSPGTLAVWRCTGRYTLPFVKVGRSVRYRRSDLDAWLSSRIQANGATA